MAEQKRFAIFPVLPRVKNVGMLHPDGYAVTVQGREGVADTALFNTYVLSEDVLDTADTTLPLVPHVGKPDKLLREGWMARKFDENE